MDDRGTAKLEWVLLVGLVALVGGQGLASLGGSFDHAVGSQASGRGPGATVGPPAVVEGMETGARPAAPLSVQAGSWSSLARGAVDIGLEPVRSARVAKPRLAGKLIRSGELRRLDWTDRSIRVGFPDYAHEAPQALRYADLQGGGTYFFLDQASVRGIDGFFVRWKSREPVELRRFDSARVGIGRQSVAVSLKDFSSRAGEARRVVSGMVATLLENGSQVLRTEAELPNGLPPWTHSDVFVSAPQLSARLLVRELRGGHNWRAGKLIAPTASRPRAPFRQVIFDTADGPVRLRLDAEGAVSWPVLYTPSGARVRPAWARPTRLR
jgi:hypothetical protein